MARTETELTETSLQQLLKQQTMLVHQHLEAQIGLLNLASTSTGISACRRRSTASTARAELIKRDLLAA